MEEIYDAIVVGAGPAGSTAAYTLGEAGYKVLVLEKERIPRYKTCGGGLAASLLEMFPFSFEPVIQSRVKAISFAMGTRRVTVPLSHRPLRMVMRADFDAHILSHARAEVQQEARVRRVEESDGRVSVETERGRYKCRYLIGADGANSVVARELGLRPSRLMAAAIEAEAPVPPGILDRFADTPLFIFGEIDMGYLWVFPKAEHLSVGIGALRPGPGVLQSTLDRVMARYGIPLEGVARHGHPVPLHVRREPIATRRVLLTGDAAGLVDPFSGEGIRFAVKSGRWAAEAILSGHLEGYQKTVDRNLGLDHTLAVGLAWLFYRFPRACFALGVRNPFTSHAFADMLSDQAGYPEVIVRMFGTLPIFLATEAAAALAGRFAGIEGKNRVREAIYPR